MKKRHLPRPGAPAGRRIAGRAQGKHGIDTYKLRGKLPEPTICPRCRAVYHDGHWQWMEPALRPRQAHEELCPACHRIEDHYPAGMLTLTGRAIFEQKAEILRIARNQERAEKGEHPLNRIMTVDAEGHETLIISTTDIHLPRRIGEAVHRAFGGDLEIKYDKENYFVRVNWRG